MEISKLVWKIARITTKLHFFCSGAFLYAQKKNKVNLRQNVSDTLSRWSNILFHKNHPSVINELSLSPNVKLLEPLNQITEDNTTVIANQFGDNLEASFSGNGLRQSAIYLLSFQLETSEIHQQNVNAEWDVGGLRFLVTSFTYCARIRQHDHILGLVRRIANNWIWVAEVEPHIEWTDGTSKVP